jgi:mannose-6-phosphate isomerase-like protein (cupin superfamily)
VANKYDKHFITEPKPTDTHHIDSDIMKFPIYVDDEVLKGAYYFMAACHMATTGQGAPPFEHSHDYDEYLIFLSTDQKDPKNLGGEVEFYLEGEKHIITKSCAVFIPAGMKHAPIYFRRIDTPIWYLATGPTPTYKIPPDIMKKIEEAQKAQKKQK